MQPNEECALWFDGPGGMSDEAKEYAVVTRAKVPKSTRYITHVYGPFTKVKAKSVKANIRAEAIRQGHEIEVSACHMIDIEGMNREAIERELAGKSRLHLSRANDECDG